MKTARGKKRVLTGIVKSCKMEKTVVVEVERRYRHPVYKKVVRSRKRYKAHNHASEAKSGDLVEIMKSRPFSKEKRWRVSKILIKAQ